MALSARYSKASDTFDSSISSDWENGGGDWGSLQWVSGGYVSYVNTGSSAIRRQTEPFGSNQYSKVVVNALTKNSIAVVKAQVRMQSGTDESAYTGGIVAASGIYKYGIQESTSAFGFSDLATTGSSPTSYSTGDYIVLEANGTGTNNLELYTSESGGAETSRLTASDATITSGSPGVGIYADTSSETIQITSWEGGDDVPPNLNPSLRDYAPDVQQIFHNPR